MMAAAPVDSRSRTIGGLEFVSDAAVWAEPLDIVLQPKGRGSRLPRAEEAYGLLAICASGSESDSDPAVVWVSEPSPESRSTSRENDASFSLQGTPHYLYQLPSGMQVFSGNALV